MASGEDRHQINYYGDEVLKVYGPIAQALLFLG